MTQSRELFEHMSRLLPDWKVRRGYRGVDKLRRPMVYTIPGPCYLPNPESGAEHSLRLIVLLPIANLEQYEISLVPLGPNGSKLSPKSPSFYVRYNTDHLSRLAAKKIILPKDASLEEVAKQASSLLIEAFENLCAHFLKGYMLGENKPKPLDQRVLNGYLKRLANRGFEEDTPSWLVNFRRPHQDSDFWFDTNIWGSEKLWGHGFRRVRITGILSASIHTPWHGDKVLRISCYTSVFEDGEHASWPWRMRSCHTFDIKGMPGYQAFKLAVLKFMEDRIKLRYKYAKRRGSFTVWDDTLPEGVVPPALLKEEIA